MATSGTSGQKHEIINPRERAVSVDINRLQQFNAANRSDLYRWFLDALTNEDVGGGGVVNAFSTGGETPMRAHVFNGILPRPQTGAGVKDMFFDPGVLLAISPDAVPNPDDSPGKVILEPGLTTPGVCVLVANALGFTSVDVIEASVIEEVTETDSRDIFDPTTGLFTATTVDKVQRSRLAYRVRRSGAPGFPGLVAGWLPLAVAIVPNGANDWDSCTLFDVRPLVSDRVRPPFNIGGIPKRRNATIFGGAPGFPAQMYLNGHSSLSFGLDILGGHYLAAGELELGDSDPDGIDVMNSAVYWEPGFAPVANHLWHLYVLFPFNLPRWVQYASVAGGRKPAGIRGIPVVTSKGPGTTGAVDIAQFIGFPAIYGFGAATTQDGMTVVSGVANSVNGHMVPIVGDKNDLQFVQGEVGANVSVASIPASTADLSVFTLNVDTHYPANATILHCTLAVVLHFPGGGPLTSTIDVDEVTVKLGAATVQLHPRNPGKIQLTQPDVSLTSFVIVTNIDVVVRKATQLILDWAYSANANSGGVNYTVPVSGVLAIRGWKLGPEE